MELGTPAEETNPQPSADGREAGRSIALDPTDGEAAGIVGRLMLEPPRTVPLEVEQHLAQIADLTSRRRALLVAFFAVGFLGFIPMLAWMGITDVGAVVAFSMAVLLNGAFALMIARRAKNASITELYVGVVFNAVVTAVLARMFTPFLVAPGIGAVSVMMFVADPRLRAKIVVPLTLAAVLGPWVLELAGALPTTISALDGDLLLHAPAVNVALPATPLALALFVATLIALSGVLAQQLGASAQASLRAVEMQAWHLRQLVKT